MALGARMEAARFGGDLFETAVFGIVSDGDLMEGVAYETASIAGHLGCPTWSTCTTTTASPSTARPT